MKRISLWIVSVTAMAALVPLAAQDAPRPSPVTVPAGTVINVRLTRDIDVDIAQAGMTFSTRVDDPVSVNGRVVIPREAAALAQAVNVAQAGQIKGKDAISLKLNNVSVGGRVYEIATDYAMVEGKGESKKSTRRIGGGAGLGAIVGGVAGGGEGAVIGGVIGGITGTAVAAADTEHLKLPAETRLQFRLASAVRIQP